MTTTRLRRDVDSLTRLASNDLAVVWRGIDTPQAARTALLDVLPSLVDTYGIAAASVAAEYYDEKRDHHGARGHFRAIPAEIRDSGGRALAGWATQEAQTPESLRILVEGGMQRRIANFARFTVQLSAIQDPAAHGWVRVGVGACKSGWCDQYLDGEIRAVAYDFPAHDNCNCHAEPAW